MTGYANARRKERDEIIRGFTGRVRPQLFGYVGHDSTKATSRRQRNSISLHSPGHGQPMKTLVLFAVSAMAVLSASANAQVESNALVITSPANGTVVAPGQIIIVSVTINSGTYPNGIGILGGEAGGPAVMLPPISGASPLSFSVTIPANAFPGKFTISAAGDDSSSGVLQTSYDVTLDVERTDSPVSLRVDPPSIHFQQIGQSLPINVTGVYADGSWHGLTRSSLLQMTSSNTAIAAVTSNSIKAVSPGKATIQVSYGSLTASVPIYVP
jgi:hypothetical protein